ncbi:MAG: hypothetical protein ACT4TC_23340 [Myxococcaceae bacterium]
MSGALLDRLRDPADNAPTAQLVSLWLDHVLAQPVSHWLPPERTVAIVLNAFSAWANTASAEEALLDAITEWQKRAAATPQRLHQLVSQELQQGAQALTGRAFSPDKTLVLAIIDREPFRQLLRTLLIDALLEFGRQLRTPASGVTKGLTGLAKMAASTARSATGSLGALAEGMVGAVSGEVERQFDKRVGDFVDSALSGLMKKLADQLSDPKRAQEQAALRQEILDGLLDLSPAQLSRELDRADLPGALALIRGSVLRFVESAEGKKQLTQALKTLTAARADQPTRRVLEELGLLEVFLRHGRELGREQLQSFFASDAFAVWCRALP